MPVSQAAGTMLLGSKRSCIIGEVGGGESQLKKWEGEMLQILV